MSIIRFGEVDAFEMKADGNHIYEEKTNYGPIQLDNDCYAQTGEFNYQGEEYSDRDIDYFFN